MFRKTISLVTLTSFLLLVLSSVLLYVLPGRGMAAVTFLGMNKYIWKNLHITGGFLFIVAGIWHTALNLRALSTYVKRAFSINAKSFAPLASALLVTAFVYAGTVYEIAPMRAVLSFGKSIGLLLAQGR